MRINYFEEEVRNIILTGTSVVEGASKVVLKATVEFDDGSSRTYSLDEFYGDIKMFEEYVNYNPKLSFEEFLRIKEYNKMLSSFDIGNPDEEDEW